MTPDELFAFFSPETFAAMLADAPLLVVLFVVYVRPWMQRIESHMQRANEERAELRDAIRRVAPAVELRDDPTPRFGVMRGGKGDS